MIEYLVGAAIIGTAVTLIDQQNLIPQLSNNPSQKWFWDPSRYTPVTPPAARLNQQIRAQPLSAKQEIQKYEIAARQADLILRQAYAKHPELAATNHAKYRITSS